MAEEFNDKKTEVSEFNEANFQILRLTNLWTDYHRCMKFGENGYDYQNAHRNLISIWVELSADAKAKNEKKYHKGIELLNVAIEKYRENDNGKLPVVLEMKAMFLKNLQEVVGKGSKKAQRHEHM